MGHPGLDPGSSDKGSIVSDLTDLTIAAMRDGLRAKSFSAAELTETHIAAIDGARSGHRGAGRGRAPVGPDALVDAL